jgi:hypothetical protein
MSLPPLLHGSHLRTYEKIFQHPVSHNLAWHDVFSLFRHLGDVSVELNGHLKVTRNGHVLILPSSRTKDVAEVEELMKLRHFLEKSDEMSAGSNPPMTHLLVVIDHHQARLFRTEMHGVVPLVIHPHTPDDYFRQAHDARDFSSGKEKPAPNSFFEPVAKAMKDAGKILIFGAGTGTSSEMEQFTTWLKKHHADLAQRITGTLTIDESHLTEAQLLAKAREFYAGPQLQENKSE